MANTDDETLVPVRHY